MVASKKSLTIAEVAGELGVSDRHVRNLSEVRKPGEVMRPYEPGLD